MAIDILTLFPDMFKGPFDESMIKRAIDKNIVNITFHQLRNWAIDKRGTVDDHPFGGGPGMLMRPEPIFSAVEEIKKSYSSIPQNAGEKFSLRSNSNKRSKVILLDAGGELFTQKKAQELSAADNLIFICGHYEGVDYRVHEHLADEVLSIGDFVLTGGELPCMIMVDSIVRLIPGVLNKEDATGKESFSQYPTADTAHLVEYPQYTHPVDFRGYTVPEILRSGHHGEIEKWQKEEAKKRTRKNRPDLLLTQ